MGGLREFWTKWKLPWCSPRRPQTRFPKLSSVDKVAFRKAFDASRSDICYLFANHWKHPNLKKYIMWFYNSIMGDRGFGIGCKVPDQCESRVKLVELFSQMWQVVDIPETVIYAFDLFFNKIEYCLANGWYQGLSWRTDEIVVILTKNNVRYVLELNTAIDIPVSWRDSPSAMTVCIDNGRYYDTIPVEVQEHIHFVNGTFALRLNGRRGLRKEITSTNYWNSESPREPIEVHGLDVTLSMRWKGPHVDIETFVDDVRLHNLPYGTLPFQ
ncbi:uncharacterized protein LOC111253531 [Varroa destructor]|uniref:Uncharacterized protein n=1 Tax=Varroa destructor TaxID=109461 RepID=A0A7M7KLL9_VARDE|nr:uncharacterized protein LOC111253531 [Varroa destructor]